MCSERNLSPQNLVPGQHCVVEMASRRASKSASGNLDLIYFVGGYSLAEVAALRTVQGQVGRNFLIAGTGNITGKTLMSAFVS